MKKVSSLSTLVLFLFIVSCGPSQKVTSSWINPQVSQVPNFQKIFVMALVQNPSYKAIIEDEIANAIAAKGKQAVKSSEFFAPNFSKNNATVDKAEILSQVRAAGCDGIFTTALVDKNSESRYVPGTTTYMPYSRYGGYGFGGYYGYMYPSMYSTPGYYTEDKTYFMEANLFDAATENMVWSAQSEAYNPSKISTFAKDYAALLVERLNGDVAGKKK